jgi:acetylornithine deacetylase
VPEEGRDALKAAHRVLSAIWELSDRMNAQGSHDLLGSAFLLVTTIGGGGYIAVPAECSFSLIGKLLPGTSIDAACAELEEAVHGAVDDPDIGIAISYPAGRDHPLGGSPVEIDRNHDAVGTLSGILELALPGRGRIEGAPYWSEVPFLVRQLGCPAVYCAPGDIRNCHTLEERVEVEEYLAGIVAFAAFFAEFCGVANA